MSDGSGLDKVHLDIAVRLRTQTATNSFSSGLETSDNLADKPPVGLLLVRTDCRYARLLQRQERRSAGPG
jgi:hypothetical protein